MKKILPIIFILSFCLLGCNSENDNSKNVPEENTSYNYTASRTATPNENNSINDIITTEPEVKTEPETKPEMDLSYFSTKIYTPNDSARQNNIRLTCSKLNGTIIKPRRDIFFL